MSLRTDIAKLARANPDLRSQLVPLLRTANFAKTLAKNYSIWSWEYDHRVREAMLFMGSKGGLELKIIETWEKSGLGAGKRETLLEEGVSVGFVSPKFKPDLGKIKQVLAKYSFERSGAGSPFKKLWTTTINTEMPLAEILTKAAAEFPQETADTERTRDRLETMIRTMDPKQLETLMTHITKWDLY